MALTYYLSAEEVRPGDRILYHGEPGRVEFTATRGDPEMEWYVEQFGGGCMIVASGFGNVFISDPEEDEDLELVSRGDVPAESGPFPGPWPYPGGNERK